MGGDSVHIVEQVVFADVHLPDSHLIDQLGCYRLPDARGAAHRPGDIKLANTNEFKRFSQLAWIKSVIVFDGRKHTIAAAKSNMAEMRHRKIWKNYTILNPNV